MLLQNIILVIIGLSSGIMIGAVFIAIMTMLQIIPRLRQLLTYRFRFEYYMIALCTGAIVGLAGYFFPISFHFSRAVALIIGLIHGTFNGLLAAALIEMLNVFPILSKRFNLQLFTYYFIATIIIGKVCGTLFQWLFLTW